MTDRAGRLAAARLIDWRFLLPDPRLGRVGVVEPADSELVAALQMLGEDVRAAPASELVGGEHDVVVVGHRGHALRPSDVVDAGRASRAGGWIVVELPAGAKRRSTSRTVERSLRAGGVERVDRVWSLPSRLDARRIVPLDNQAALRATMSMHGSRPVRRVQAAVARQVARLSGADLLGGEVTLLARRLGGEPTSRWPCLGSLEAVFAREGLDRPSWLLLTPRFPASAYVVFLLLADGAPALVAKVSRLPEDDGPEREAETLRALEAAKLDPGCVPQLIQAGRLGGHAFLLERALEGRPLDRHRTRGDPRRWIAAVASWTGQMPVDGRLTADAHDTLLQAPIEGLRGRLGDPAAALVDATLAALEPLRAAEPPLVFEHGDLGHPNLRELPDGRIGVLDWELARPDGLPLNDLVFFIGYVALAIGGDSADPFASFEGVLADRRWRAADAIRMEAQRRGLAPALIPPLVVACWARATAGLAGRLGDGPSAADPRALRSHRYYSLWSRAVEHQGQLAALLS